MEIQEYQQLAGRTVNKELNSNELQHHALHGLVGELGEIHSLYQKVYQGHTFDENHAKKELGDLMWFVAEYCISLGWDLTDVCKLNIEKLQARYPEGFSCNNSLVRKEGDI